MCRVWNIAAGTCKAVLLGHTDHVTRVALLPDGDTVVSSSEDKTLR